MTNGSLKDFWVEGDSAEKMWGNKVSVVLKDKHYRFAVGSEYYLLDDTFCYGIIKLTGVNRVQPSEFHNLFDKHQVDNKERVSRWKTANKIIYMYDFDLLNRFESPSKVLVPNYPRPFIDNFLVLDEVNFKEINLKDEYIIKTLSDSALINGWGNVLGWYSSLKEGNQISYSEKSVTNIITYLYEELVNRKIEFKLSEIPNNCKGLFHEMSGNVCYKVELLNSQLTPQQDDTTNVEYFNDLNKLSSTLFKGGS